MAIVKAAFAQLLTPGIIQDWEGSVTKRQLYMKSPAGQRQLKKMQAGFRRASKARKQQAERETNNLGVKNEYETEVSYAFGRIEKELEIISRSTKVPHHILTLGVAELLRHQEGR